MIPSNFNSSTTSTQLPSCRNNCGKKPVFVFELNGKTSSTKEMPGSDPQGKILGLFTFIIVFNLVGNPSSYSTLGKAMTDPASQRKVLGKKKCMHG